MATVSSSTSTTSYSYTSSGSSIDWNALIEVAVAAKTAPADRIDLQIASNETKLAAYQDMQALLQAILSVTDTIRGTTDSLTVKDDIFSLREAYLTAQGSVNAESAVVVTAQNGVNTGSYDLQILQLASVHKVAGDTFASNTEELGLSGTLSLALGDGDSVTYDIDETMSLKEIAALINANSTQSGIQASVVKVAEDSYRLVLSGTETGQEIVLSSLAGDIGSALGLTSEDGSFANEVQAAKDAVIRIDGIEITRKSNTIDDVIDGLTFNLYQITGEDASIAVEIANDLTSIKSAITDLVTAYNAYRDWALTQQATGSSGAASSDAVLFGDGTLRSANTQIAAALATLIDETSMALLGLSYDSQNKLVLNETTLNNALLNDLASVEKLLSFQMTSSSSDVALLSRSTAMPDSLTLDIVVDENGAIASVAVDGDASAFTVNGARIIGAKGTAYEGITFVFTGSASQSVELSFSSGLTEKLATAVAAVADSSSGTLAEIIANLTDKNTALEERASSIRSRAESYRSFLTQRYAAYQAAIEQANSTLTYLEALLNAGDD
ncbi:flagellar filament capping protein FliD [Polymorphum gilvum]|uniref:Flagellar hook-associated protein 2 n=1 Tax=Polymorphum gilvum (strain LMG 25793 / CGMCC 1.9160 / SL003B-26A1) TaxID=991905 RepID=F2J620_POLGS|nr:flagellar filament capping protein FliD [Polymorphum gilvum]ADZ72384.1 Flagellar hook-associated 2-like protein [Polymorphum gilvum SL003B-26A1]